MFDDDNEPLKQKKSPKKLDGLSIHELTVYVADLKNEIDRANAEIKKKEAHMNAASSLFKTKS